MHRVVVVLRFHVPQELIVIKQVLMVVQDVLHVQLANTHLKKV
jgi:hypothetical protein